MAPSGEERRGRHGRGGHGGHGGGGRGGFGRGASRSFRGGGRRDGQGWGGRRPGDQKKIPNVFIAAKIDNSGIRSAVQEVQDACVQGNASLKVHCQNAPVKKTHVTVLVAHVTEPQLETAKALVDNVLQNKILPHLPHKEFKISFKGMSSFGEKIVYAEVADGEAELRMMNEAFLEAFETAGFDCDSRYTPHMTVMKGGFTDIGIPRDSFNHSRDKDFGCQVISSLQLLSMKKPVTDEGFYHCEGSYDFGESGQKSKENRSDEESSTQQSEEGAGEVKMDIVDTEQPLLSAQESKKTDLKENLANREDEERGIRGKKKPNVFIAVELDNPEIIQKMQDMQDQACQFDPKLKSNAVPLKKAHITLLVANVQEEELPKARAVISKTFRDNLAKIVPENQFTVEIKGVDSFGEKVVFAEIDQGKSFLMQLNEELLRAFEDADFDCDSRYTPHVTILKTGYRSRGGIPKEAYESFLEQEFGSQTIAGAKLLSMHKKQTEEGHYYPEGEYVFKDIVEQGERMTATEKEEEEALIASKPEVNHAKVQRTKSGPEWAAEWKAKHGKGKKKNSVNKNPNVFIAFELDSQAIQEEIRTLQKACISKNPDLKPHCDNVPVEKAHITVLAAHVEEEQLDKAKRVIERVLRNQIVKAVPTEFDVELRGIDAFGDKIVYAEVDKGEDHLRLINEKLLDAFEQVGFSCDARFTPHVTLMKVGLGVYSGIPREVYSQFMDKTFGGQSVSSLKLLSMTKRPTEDGRYFPEAEFNLDQMRQLGEDLRTEKEMESERADGVASKKIKIDRSRPNAFLAIQLTSQELISSIKEVQQECVREDQHLKDFIVPAAKAHIPLLAFNVQEDEVEKVREMVMRVLVAKVDRQLLTNNFQVEVKGLDTFDNRGLYAEVGKGDGELRMFNEVLMDKFEEEGFVCDARFTPHVSIFKDKAIPEEVFKHFGDKHFGIQEVSGIQLLSSAKPPKSDGSYHCYGNFKFKYVTSKSD